MLVAWPDTAVAVSSLVQCNRAMEILDAVEPLRRAESPFLFPSFLAGKPPSNVAFDVLLTRMKVRSTAHGVRSSFRDWVGVKTSCPENRGGGSCPRRW
jgi:hypothetical protein